jgi:hypothetical protein
VELVNPVDLVRRRASAVPRTSGLADASPPAWRWALAISLAALVSVAAIKAAPYVTGAKR